MPIFLVENAIYGYEWWDKNGAKYQQDKRNNLYAAYKTLVAAGDTALFYVEGDKMLAPYIEPQSTSVDGVHPTDLGMYRMADFWVEYLTTFLGLP